MPSTLLVAHPVTHRHVGVPPPHLLGALAGRLTEMTRRYRTHRRLAPSLWMYEKTPVIKCWKKGIALAKYVLARNRDVLLTHVCGRLPEDAPERRRGILQQS